MKKREPQHQNDSHCAVSGTKFKSILSDKTTEVSSSYHHFFINSRTQGPAAGAMPNQQLHVLYQFPEQFSSFGTIDFERCTVMAPRAAAWILKFVASVECAGGLATSKKLVQQVPPSLLWQVKTHNFGEFQDVQSFQLEAWLIIKNICCYLEQAAVMLTQKKGPAELEDNSKCVNSEGQFMECCFKIVLRHLFYTPKQNIWIFFQLKDNCESLDSAFKDLAVRSGPKGAEDAVAFFLEIMEVCSFASHFSRSQ